MRSGLPVTAGRALGLTAWQHYGSSPAGSVCPGGGCAAEHWCWFKLALALVDQGCDRLLHMATHFSFADMVAFRCVAPGQIVTVPILARGPTPRYRIRDVSVSALGAGTWPLHTERAPELYIILSGQVIYHTPSHRFVVTAGEGILFETGDSHSTEVPEGLLSVAINLIEI